MSNRLTFSLASLIVIFALAFAATPVMAQGPTVSRVEAYSGPENPAANPVGQPAHTQTRNDFRVKIIFSEDVQADGAGTAPNTNILEAADLAFRTQTAGTWSVGADTAVSAVTGIYESTNADNLAVLSKREYVVTLPALAATVDAAGLGLTHVALVVNAAAIRGVNTPQNVPHYVSGALELPPISISDDTSTPPVVQGAIATAASFGAPEAVDGTPGSFTIELALTMDAVPTSAAGSVDLDASAAALDTLFDITPDPTTGTADITLTAVTSPATNPVVDAGVRTYSLTVANIPTGTVVTLTLPATYVGVSATATVPVAFAAPTMVTATPDTERGTIVVAWDWSDAAADADNFAGFEIQWTNPSRMTLVEGLDARSYTIPARQLTQDRPTTVTVRATKATGSTIESSPRVTAMPAPVTPSDDTAPTLTITPPTAAETNGQLLFTFDFSEMINEPAPPGRPFEISRSTSNVLITDTVMPDADNPVTNDDGDMVYRYTLLVTPLAGTTTSTVVVLQYSAVDVNGNALQTDVLATYTPSRPPGDTIKPTVAISLATGTYVHCSLGSALSITPTDNVGLATGANGAVAVGEVSTATPGWTIVDRGGSIMVVPDSSNRNAAIGQTEVTVTVAANAVRDGADNGNVSTSETFTIGPVLTVPANSYILVIHTEHANRTHLRGYNPTAQQVVGRPLVVGSTTVIGTNTNIQYWDCMPDLTIFFGLNAPAIGGGAIVVKVSPEHGETAMTRDANGNAYPVPKGSVGISEIMWGSDEGIPHGGIAPEDAIAGRRGQSNLDQTREQWIELHNRNSHDVIVTLVARPTNTALTNEGAAEIDRVSNYNISTASRNVWAVPGQSGNSEFGVDFVSMQRGKHDNKGLAPNTAEGYAHGHWNGSHSNRWSVSTHSYQRARSGLWQTLAPENQNYDYFGTPGGPNKLSPDTLPNKTGVSRTIVFNEVANRRDQTLEWIELKNTTTGKINLRNYHISMVVGVDNEKPLYTFPNNDNTQIEAGEVLLLVASDPRYNDDHPVAVGHNIHSGTDQVLGIGDDAPRYVDMSRVSDGNRGYESNGLPDDGNFVLIFRRPDGHDKHNTARNKMAGGGNIVDLVGYHPNLVKHNGGAPLYSRLWPLTLFNSPNKTRNRMDVETVHYRRVRNNPDQGDNNKPEQIALNDAHYSGIGYKRHAKRNLNGGAGPHGGSPGYENSGILTNLSNATVSQGKVTTVGQLTISEIMIDQGDSRYPQWIEIYNHSDTQAINLHADDGWRVLIYNYDDAGEVPRNEEIPIAMLSGTLNFKNSDVQTIPPNQTVLVTSTRARTSGSAFFDTSVIFPPTRVFSVYDDARNQLGQTRSTDPILSTKGFYIELIDGKGNFSDGVGNLVPNPDRRVATQNRIEWSLSDVTGDIEEGQRRSSIMRRYRIPSKSPFRDVNDEDRDGNDREVLWPKYSASDLMKMGVTAEGWVLASMTNFNDVTKTWYGDRDDWGSPGITTGRVLPVELSTFRPVRLDDGSVAIRWITESEKDNAGFNILRSDKRDGEFTKLNTQLIAGNGTTSERNTYEFTDKTAKPNVIYYYQIQDVSLDGDIQVLRITHLRGHVSAAGKVTTTWGKLKSLQ